MKNSINVIRYASPGRYSLLILLMILALLLQGCATRAGKATPAGKGHPVTANEALLKAARNYAGLLALYKGRLDNSPDTGEQDRNRLLLSEVYLSIEDPESALYYLEPVISEGRGTASVWFQKSRALLAMGHGEEAVSAATTALAFNSGDPAIYNQLGLIYASMDRYRFAREYFNKARDHNFNYVAIINNLAMMDILEKNYLAAIKRLMPLYRSGQADDSVRANLLVALAREGMYKEFSRVYNRAYGPAYRSAEHDEQRMMLYQVLSRAGMEGEYGS